MANYPNPIKGTGTIKTEDDIFNWWKASFVARDPLEGFGVEFTALLNTFPSFPFNRASFYSWVDNGYGKDPSNVSYYTYDTPGVGWNNRNVSDWGTIKSLELALFGNIANGGNTTTSTLSKYVIGDTNTMGVSKWTHHDMVYLRYALRRFESYGTCIEKYDSGSGIVDYPLVHSTITFPKTVVGLSDGAGQFDFYIYFNSSHVFTSIPSSMQILFTTRSTGGGSPIPHLFTPTSVGPVLGAFNYKSPDPSIIEISVMNIIPNPYTDGSNKIYLDYTP